MIKVLRYDDNKKEELKGMLLKRKSIENAEVLDAVKSIIKNVRLKGDEALFSYTEQFDNISLDTLIVSKEEILEESSKVHKKLKDIMIEAMENITAFHEKSKINSWCDYNDDGSYMGQRVIPLERVGVYVPGGTAVYPSSVLMNVIPAKVAGVKEIAMVTPPMKDGRISSIVAAVAEITGIKEIYKVGGAQAIAALAYGTDTIRGVDKIVGPGNIFVATAKKEVFGDVDIDMIAGPSEILVIADKYANAKCVAADLLSQAEHDKMASSIFITDCEKLMNEVVEEIKLQVTNLNRKEIIEASLKNYSMFILCDNLLAGIDVANYIAPEHLELMTSNASELLGKIKNAGSIFLGYSTPEPVGDYFGGPNHILPTLGTARFFSPLSTESFLKKSSFIYYSEEKLKLEGEKIISFAESEGLTAHSNSIKVRVR